MTEYFVPRTGEITLSDGSKRVLVKGVREVDHDVAGDPAATRYGVKPVHEMTAAERVEHKLPPAPPDVDESIKVEPEVDKPEAGASEGRPSGGSAASASAAKAQS